jgi:hypothetical protein
MEIIGEPEDQFMDKEPAVGYRKPTEKADQGQCCTRNPERMNVWEDIRHYLNATVAYGTKP